MVELWEHQTAASAAAVSSRRHDPIRASRLASLLLVALIAGVGTGCGVISEVYKALSCITSLGGACGDDPGENKPAADCLPKGPELCGPPWDRDNDTISTATETNPTNRIGNSPISGFYYFDTLRWDLNRSIARGSTTSGSLDYGMNVRDDSTGYTHSIYRGCDGVDDDDWGTGHLLRLIEGSGRDWAYYRSPLTRPRIQTGDMSLRTGGLFATCGDPHEWHRNGLDVDVRYVGKDGYEGPLDICLQNQAGQYDTTATLRLFETIVVLNGDSRNGKPWVSLILADTTCLGFVNAPDDPYIVHDADHRNHFHVRIRDPDGPNN